MYTFDDATTQIPPASALTNRASKYKAQTKINTLDAERLGTVLNVSHCVFYKEVVAGYTIYLFEFKLTGNGSAEDAIVQIQKQNYAGQYKGNDKKIVLIGASFNENMRTIKEWKVERF